MRQTKSLSRTLLTATALAMLASPFAYAQNNSQIYNPKSAWLVKDNALELNPTCLMQRRYNPNTVVEIKTDITGKAYLYLQNAPDNIKKSQRVTVDGRKRYNLNNTDNGQPIASMGPADIELPHLYEGEFFIFSNQGVETAKLPIQSTAVAQAKMSLCVDVIKELKNINTNKANTTSLEQLQKESVALDDNIRVEDILTKNTAPNEVESYDAPADDIENLITELTSEAPAEPVANADETQNEALEAPIELAENLIQVDTPAVEELLEPEQALPITENDVNIAQEIDSGIDTPLAIEDLIEESLPAVSPEVETLAEEVVEPIEEVTTAAIESAEQPPIEDFAVEAVEPTEEVNIPETMDDQDILNALEQSLSDNVVNENLPVETVQLVTEEAPSDIPLDTLEALSSDGEDLIESSLQEDAAASILEDAIETVDITESYEDLPPIDTAIENIQEDIIIEEDALIISEEPSPIAVDETEAPEFSESEVELDSTLEESLEASLSVAAEDNTSLEPVEILEDQQIIDMVDESLNDSEQNTPENTSQEQTAEEKAVEDKLFDETLSTELSEDNSISTDEEQEIVEELAEEDFSDEELLALLDDPESLAEDFSEIMIEEEFKQIKPMDGVRELLGLGTPEEIEQKKVPWLIEEDIDQQWKEKVRLLEKEKEILRLRLADTKANPIAELISRKRNLRTQEELVEKIRALEAENEKLKKGLVLSDTPEDFINDDLEIKDPKSGMRIGKAPLSETDLIDQEIDSDLDSLETRMDSFLKGIGEDYVLANSDKVSPLSSSSLTQDIINILKEGYVVDPDALKIRAYRHKSTGTAVTAWEAGDLQGRAERTVLPPESDFTAYVDRFLNAAQLRCNGNFTAVPDTSTRNLRTLDIHCNDGAIGQRSSVLFVKHGSIITAIATTTNLPKGGADFLRDIRKRIIEGIRIMDRKRK